MAIKRKEGLVEKGFCLEGVLSSMQEKILILQC